MQIECFEFNMFGENTYIVFDTTSHECAIIDPGMMVERERSIIDNFIKKNCLKPKFILLTHLHVDHVFGVSHLVEKYGLKVYGNLADAMLGSRIMEQVQMFHLPVQMAAIAIDENLSDGDKVNIAAVMTATGAVNALEKFLDFHMVPPFCSCYSLYVHYKRAFRNNQDTLRTNKTP